MLNHETQTNELNTSAIAALQHALKEGKVLTGRTVRERFHHIWETDQGLEAKAVVLPKSTQDVADILRICHEYNQPVVVHGGLTNMVGSTETTAEEVVISMEKMNAIEETDEKNKTLTAQAGVILENIHNAAAEKGLLFPLTFGAKGSAQIGGVVSTNAGGLRVFRFGMTRHLVLGLEAVLADGTIVTAMKKLIKDNSGYDIKQLLIGSEGTLGVITKVVLKLVEAPKSRNIALGGFHSYDEVLDFLKFMDGQLSGTLSGFELIWGDTYKAMTSAPATVTPPLPHGLNYYVLMETLGAYPESDQVLLQDLLAQAMEKGLVEDAVVASNAAEVNRLWSIREDVDVIVSQCNNTQHFDVSIPIAQIGDYVDDVLRSLQSTPEVERYFVYGHMADGNIHFMVGKTNDTPELIHRINEIIYKPLKTLGGSISAEHGIGVHKKPYLPITKSEAEIRLMRTLKAAMDPKGILNMGKVVDL